MRLSRREVFWKSLILLICMLPFLYIPSVFNPFEFPKFIMFVTGVFVIAIFFIVKMLNQVQHDNKKVRNDTLTTFILLYVLVVFLSDIIGMDPRISLFGSMWRHQGFITLLSGITLCFLLSMIQLRERQTTFLFLERSIFIGAIGICFIALFHAYSVFILHDNTVPLYNGRIVGTFGNPNFLGGYLVMVFPFVLLVKNLFKKHISNTLFFVLQALLIGCIFFVLFLTGSRSSIGSAGVIFCICLCVLIGRLKNVKKKFLIGFGVIFIASMIFYFPKLLQVFNRQSQWENRSIIYSTGIQAILKRPILGYGQENFELLFPKAMHVKIDSAHNIFLETAISSGIVGFILFCVIIVFTFLNSSTLIKLSLLGFLLVAQFNPVSIAQIAFFWLLIGFSRKDLY